MLTHAFVVRPAAPLILGTGRTLPGLSHQGTTCPVCWELAAPEAGQGKLHVSWMDFFSRVPATARGMS